MFLGLQVLARRTRSIINVETQSRIIGGYPIPIDKAPWTVSLLYCGDPICGGSIVSITKILTAAHCTAAGNTQDFLIRAGSSETMTGGQVREISEIIVHPQFSHDPAKGNDISMLFLTKPLILSANVAVIGLDKGTLALPSGIEVFTTGWGTTYDNGPRTLRAVSIQIIGNDRCSKMYEYEIFSSMLCAGLGGKGSCFGDSGGLSVACIPESKFNLDNNILLIQVVPSRSTVPLLV